MCIEVIGETQLESTQAWKVINLIHLPEVRSGPTAGRVVEFNKWQQRDHLSPGYGYCVFPRKEDAEAYCSMVCFLTKGSFTFPTVYKVVPCLVKGTVEIGTQTVCTRLFPTSEEAWIDIVAWSVEWIKFEEERCV